MLNSLRKIESELFDFTISDNLSLKSSLLILSFIMLILFGIGFSQHGFIGAIKELGYLSSAPLIMSLLIYIPHRSLNRIKMKSDAFEHQVNKASTMNNIVLSNMLVFIIGAFIGSTITIQAINMIKNNASITDYNFASFFIALLLFLAAQNYQTKQKTKLEELNRIDCEAKDNI